MPTTSKMKVAKSSPARASVAAHRRATTRASNGHTAARNYTVPIAAALGAGALAATGFVLREPISELMDAAMDGIGTAWRLSPAKLLALAGMQRRRSLLSVAMPGLGGLAIGLASGAAVALWLVRTPKTAEASHAEPIEALNHDSRVVSSPPQAEAFVQR